MHAKIRGTVKQVLGAASKNKVIWHPPILPTYLVSADQEHVSMYFVAARLVQVIWLAGTRVKHPDIGAIHIRSSAE